MAAEGLAYYRGGDPSAPDRLRRLPARLGGGHLPVQPGPRRAAADGADDSGYDVEWLAGAIGRDIYDPYALYEHYPRRHPSEPARAGDDAERSDEEERRMTTTDELRARARRALEAIGADVSLGEPGGHGLPASTPITGEVLFTVAHTTPEQADQTIADAAERFRPGGARRRRCAAHWWPGSASCSPNTRTDLATLVTLEVGKITSEALGEVQEMIDVCQFAVGLSRQLYGRTIASERPGHRLLETWHPLGVVGVITAFNFPVAVWAWNAAVALVCGDTVVWKPSELTPLTALACQALIGRAAADVGAPPAVSVLVLGDRGLGERLVDDPRIALVSATGSVRMGQAVGPRVAGRFGRALLELGGNNAAIVTPAADLDLAVRAIVFAAAGTAGQRCTSLRRLIVHRSVADDVAARVVAAFRQLPVGDPSAPGTLVGPLIHETAYRDMVGASVSARYH